MKKGEQIYMVIINDGKRVSIQTIDKKPLKVTRSQRNALMNWKDNPNYVTDIVRAFSNDKILHPQFSVVQDGETVFKR